jgi:DNA polymerase III delta subunit
MIYLFHGSDASKVRAKAFQWIAASRAKAPDAMYLRIQAENLTPSSLGDAMSAQGLFFSKTLVLIDDPFSDTTAGELVLDSLKQLASSENPIAILAPKLLATRLKKIEPHAAKVFEVNETKKKEARGFNGSLVNALGAKDGAVLWKEIVKAHRQGDAPEAVHGLLHWKARDLMQKGSPKWRPDEARALSRALIELVSDARSGSLELQPSLERFALTLLA